MESENGDKNALPWRRCEAFRAPVFLGIMHTHILKEECTQAFCSKRSPLQKQVEVHMYTHDHTRRPTFFYFQFIYSKLHPKKRDGKKGFITGVRKCARDWSLGGLPFEAPAGI